MDFKDYSEKPKPLFKKGGCKRTESVLMGLELEVTFDGQSVRDDFIDDRDLDVLSRHIKT